MGMFDYVKYEAPCKACGVPVREFQSKDGPCELRMLKPKHVDRFYGICPSCDTWNEFEVKRKCKVKKIKQVT